MLALGTSAYASTVWDPAANGINPPAVGNWNVAANWTNGLPGTAAPAETKVQFNKSGAAECHVTDAQSCLFFVQGDNNVGGIIRVMPGGSITTGANWSAIGYNNTAHTIVEVGGTLTFGGYMRVGLNSGAEGTLDINGGTVNATGNVKLGGTGCTGYVNINGGALNLDHWDYPGSISNGVLDIKSGAVNITNDGDQSANALNFYNDGKITAFGGAGILNIVHVAGVTTITATPTGETDPPTPNPASFSVPPAAIGSTTITMTATIGSDVSGPVEYLFSVTSVGDPNVVGSGWQTDNSFTATGLTADTTYTYSVTMRDYFGTEGTASGGASATTWSATRTDINWNPAGNGIFPPSTGDWDDSGNWTTSAAGRPDGNYRCIFKYSNAAECVVSSDHVFQDFIQGWGGPGGVIRVENGGSLTTMGGWMSIGFNNTATFIVEEGGVADFAGHAWLGMNDGANAIIEINGGTFSSGGAFGLGYHDSTPTLGVANIYVNSGTFNIDRWIAGTSAIQPGSGIDIKEGSVVINDDKTGIVADFVAAGKITAYGGTGRVLYDYNATNPGKITIKALEGVEGDVDGDNDVDFDDALLFVREWLDPNCSSPANFDGYCIIDLRDFAILASNWLSGIITDWHVADTVFPSEDYVITPHWAEDFGIVGDGVTDVTDAIQDALISVSNLGGGALYLPAGNYKVSGNLTVPSRVTLRGDWQKPVPGSPIVGTILQAYAGRGDIDGTPFIELSGSSGVRNIAIWYPEQDPAAIEPYPPTLHGGGVTLENVTLVNPYFGFTTTVQGTTACPFVRGVYGTPLYIGTEYDRLADIGRIETVHFSPDFWAGSGLPGAPTAGEHESWIYNNGTGMIVRRIDWSYSCYVTVEGYNIGLALRPSPQGSVPNGQSYGFELIDCKTGIYIEQSAGAGYQFTRFNIQGAETGVYLGPATEETNMFHTCTIDATGDAVFSEGTAKVMMMSCDIQQGTVDIDGGYLSVINSDFGATATNHIELSSGVHGASILGNTFAGGAQIANSTTYPVHIDHTVLAVDALPAYDYKKPTTVYKPATSDLFVVTKRPYNAQADGVTDDTAAFQAALADADANGGGTVFVPGGVYRLDGNLTVPTGVELRGVFDIAHGSRVKGSLLNVYGGRGNASGTPFIQIEPNAGIKGLTFHYPEQIYDRNDPDGNGMYGMVPYPFLIRGLGSDVYVLNIAATIPYQILDLATYRSDRHYVDYIKSTALKTGIHVGNGSTDGQIHNCQFNPSLYTHQGLYYDSIPTNFNDDSDPPKNNIHKILWRDATPYLFGHMVNEVIHENFVFGGMKGMHLVEEGGFGPSGYCMGMGVDQCTNALQIDNIGSGGLDMINSQIVTTNSTIGRYLEVGDPFDDTFRMFGSAGWGGPQYSAVINGGDVRLQLFHVNREPAVGAFMVNNDASLQNLGGSFTSDLRLGRDFLTIESTATAEFIGNVIDTDATQMPANTFNVTSIGNLRVQ